MATLPFYILACFLFFLLLLLPHSTTSTETCTWRFCGSSPFGPPIQFPFKLKGDGQSDRCGYPGFEVFCSNKNKNQTLLHLPNGGVFELNSISYPDRKLWINDPDDCLPKLFLRQRIIDFSGSPFELSDELRLVNFTFLTCSNVTSRSFYPMEPLACLSDGKSDTSVVAMASDLESGPSFATSPINLSGCQAISWALVPFNEFGYGSYWAGQIFGDIQLQWNKPTCEYPDCELSSNKSKIGLGLGLGIPAGIIWLIVVLYMAYTAKKRRTSRERVGEGSIELNNNQQLQPSITAPAMAVGEADIDRYPKTKVGDDGKLPNPNNDTVCSICLSEYQPKEILRTIPDCNHYFHAHCLEGWLKINASCPLCRNLPKSSSSLTCSNLPQSSSSS